MDIIISIAQIFGIGIIGAFMVFVIASVFDEMEPDDWFSEEEEEGHDGNS